MVSPWSFPRKLEGAVGKNCEAADAHPLNFEDRYAFVLSTLMGEQTCFREKEVSIFVYLLACSNMTVPTLPCSLQLRFTGRPCEAGVFKPLSRP